MRIALEPECVICEYAAWVREEDPAQVLCLLDDDDECPFKVPESSRPPPGAWGA